jgi:hypothetical protein
VSPEIVRNNEVSLGLSTARINNIKGRTRTIRYRADLAIRALTEKGLISCNTNEEPPVDDIVVRISRLERLLCITDEYPLPSEYILAVNLDRRQLTTDQMTMVGAKWLPIYQAEAKERKVKAGKETGRGHKRSVSNGTDLSTSHRSDDEAAKKVGVSRRKIRQAAELILNSPGLAARVESGRLPGISP